MTGPDVETARTLLDAATDGEWRAKPVGGNDDRYLIKAASVPGYVAAVSTAEDARLIVYAVNVLPAHLAAIEDLKTRLAAVECYVDQYGWIKGTSYMIGEACDEVTHADPCDCDEDEEQVGDACMALSSPRPALLHDEGAHGWSTTGYLRDPFGADDDLAAVVRRCEDEHADLLDRLAAETARADKAQIGANEAETLADLLENAPCVDESHADLLARAEAAEAERDRLRAVVNNPQPHDFIEGAVVEAQYQQVRCDDSNKSDAEWFWTLGYLVSKVLHRDETPERRQHHLTAAAGLLANWHAHIAACPDDQTHSRDPEAPDAG